MKCLWCNKEIGQDAFCLGGGETITKSRTRERGNFTKSYCMDSFLTVLRMNETLNIGLTDNEKTFLLYEQKIKDWYDQIPFINDHHTNATPKKREGIVGQKLRGAENE